MAKQSDQQRLIPHEQAPARKHSCTSPYEGGRRIGGKGRRAERLQVQGTSSDARQSFHTVMA